MKQFFSRPLFACAGVILGLLGQEKAGAALVFNFSEVGSDVVITASGTVDLTGLSSAGDYNPAAVSEIQQTAGGNTVIFNAVGDGSDIYSTVNPLSAILFNNTFGTLSGTTTGDTFGLYSNATTHALYFNDGFAGGAVNGTLTIPNTDLATLGFQQTSLSWGGGANQQLVIIPEPGCLALLGLGGIAFIGRRRR